jgi:hypothetical protein
MTRRNKIFIVIYLMIWTSAVASWSISYMMHAIPGFGASAGFFQVLAITLAVIASLRWSRWLVRDRDRLRWSRLMFYFLGVPALIFLTLAVLTSAMWLIYAPAAFIGGVSLGLPALIVGTAIHILGLVPIWLASFRNPII